MEYQTAIAALLTGIGTLIGSLLTLWWTKGVDAAIRLKKAEGEESRALLLARKESNLIALETAHAELAKMDERLKTLEASLCEIQVHHEECMEKHRDCEKRCAHMEGRLEGICEQLDRIEKVEKEK